MSTDFIPLSEIDQPAIVRLAQLAEQMKNNDATATNDRAERPSA